MATLEASPGDAVTVRFTLVGEDGTPALGEVGQQPKIEVDGGAPTATGITVLSLVQDNEYKATVTCPATPCTVRAIYPARAGFAWFMPGDTIRVVADEGGTGAFPVTLTVLAGAVPIQNAKVRINATGGDCVLTTDSAGQVALNLDAGTYTAYVGIGASYTPAASYTVTVNASGVVTAPTDGHLHVTAVALPTPSSPTCYSLWDTQTDELDAAFGAAGVTVTVVGLSDEGRVDATNNRFRSIMGRSDTADAAGQWALDIPIQAFTAQATLTLRFAWTDAAGAALTEDWSAVLAAPSSGTQVCWSDLSPYKVG
jgi:hypothetical protein